MDTWCYKNNGIEFKDTDFCIGNCMSCDGAMITVFHKAGYRVFNDVMKYRTFHNDTVREINRYKSSGVIFTDYSDLCYPDDGLNSQVCPLQDYEIALFDKNMVTDIRTSDRATYNKFICRLCYERPDPNIHRNVRKVPDKDILKKIETYVGHTLEDIKKNLNLMVSKYDVNAKRLKEWKSYDRFETMIRQLYYFINIWNLGKSDWMDNQGFDEKLIDMISNDIMKIIQSTQKSDQPLANP